MLYASFSWYFLRDYRSFAETTPLLEPYVFETQLIYSASLWKVKYCIIIVLRIIPKNGYCWIVFYTGLVFENPLGIYQTSVKSRLNNFCSRYKFYYLFLIPMSYIKWLTAFIFQNNTILLLIIEWVFKLYYFN